MATRPKSEAANAGRIKPRLSPEPESASLSGAADESLLADIKVVMEDMHSDITSKIDSRITETVNRVVSVVLEPIKSTIDAHGKALADLKCTATVHSYLS